MAMATQAADPWWQLSPEEKKRIVQDTWAAALIDDLNMCGDEDDDTAASSSYGVPASKKAMMDLYTPTWDETAVREDGHAGCAVCLEGLGTDQKLRMMPCHHTFHQLCIFKWLYVNRVCPICQFALPSDQEQCLLDQEEKKKRVRGMKEAATNR